MLQRSLKRLSSIRIQSKTRNLTFIAVILSFVLSTLVSVYSLRMESELRTKESNAIIADIVHDHIIQHLLHTIEAYSEMSKEDEFIHMLVHEDDVGDSHEDNIVDFLSGIKLGLSYESSFVVSEKTHKYYTSNGLLKIIKPDTDPHDSWYKNFIDKNVDYEFNVEIDDHHEGQWIIFFNQRVVDKKGGLLGVCGIGIKVANLQKVFKKIEDSYSVKIDLVDSKGLVQVDTDSNKIVNDIIKGITNIPNDENESIKFTSLDGKTRTVKYIPRIGWYLVVEDSKLFDSSIYLKVILINILLCLLMSSIIIFVFYYIMYKIGYLNEDNTTDPLTGGHNKQAFEDDIRRLRSENSTNICIVATDINGINECNKKLGHDKGDELIKGAHKCLEMVFSNYGFVYRTGGDDFTMLLIIEPFELELKFIELNRLLENWSKNNNLDLSLSIGFSTKAHYPFMTVNELITNAKEMLGHKKREFKRLKSIKEELLSQ